MKERKPLFPEYIWMFFVGLLLAIIVCMRLLPGQAAMYEETAYNNVIYVRLSGWTIYFGDAFCDPATSVLNEDNSNWSENDLFKSDLEFNIYMLTNKFGADNLSVCLLDDGAVAYSYRYIAALLYKYNIECLSYDSEQTTGTIDDLFYIVNPAPWRDDLNHYFFPYYEYYTFSLSSYTLGYYVQHNQYVTPTPSLSPSPTPDPEIQSIICKDTSGYYFMFDFYVSDFGSSISFDLNDNNALTSAMSTYNLSNNWINPASWQMYWSGSGSYRSHVFVYFSGSVSEIYMYEIGSSLVSSDFDYIRNNFEGSLVSDSTSNVFYGSSEGLFGFDFAPYKGYYSSNPTELIVSSFSYKTRDYVSEGQNFPSNYLFSKSNVGLNFPLYCAYTLGLEGSSGETAGPSPTVTPSLTPTPTQAPYVEVILPSPTPGPTAPVSFNDSDLPGGASGEGGSISTNDGASSSTADGVYNYWSYVLSQNQALAFIASFFQILPFDLVYALGSLIFILILIAMARLFIHFIE